MADGRRLADSGQVEGARPYTLAGNRPANAVVTGHMVHGAGRLYISDVPYDEPYNDRATCAGHRTDGKPCKAKARPGEGTCVAHTNG